MSRYISLIALVVVIVVFAALFYRVMAGFILPLFLAALLTVIFRPVHRWMLARCGRRTGWAAALTTAAILIIVLVPLSAVMTLAIHEGLRALSNFQVDESVAKLDQVRERLGLELPFAPLVKQLDDQIQQLPSELPSETQPADSPLAQQIGQTEQTMFRLAEQLESDPRHAQDAQSFRHLIERLAAVRGFVTRTDRAPSAPHTPPDEEIDPTAPIPVQYRQLATAYQTFRVDLLGGPLRAWAINLANPNGAQLDQFRGKIESYLRGSLPSITGQATAIAGNLVFGLIVMVLATYYFLKDGPGMIRAAMRLSPLEDRYEKELLSEFDSVSRAVVLATLLSALAQGILAGVGFFFAGLPSVFILTILTMLLAMVPFIGAAAVWVPACLWLALVEQRFWAAGFLALYGVAIISMIDNVIKPLVLHGQSKLHPLLALLSVLGGVRALGPIGIVVGPLVVSFLQALLNMLHGELQSLGESTGTPQQAPPSPGDSGPPEAKPASPAPERTSKKKRQRGRAKTAGSDAIDPSRPDPTKQTKPRH